MMKAQPDLGEIRAPSKRALARIPLYPWDRIADDLNTYGAAVLPGLLSAAECASVSALFSDPTLSRIPSVDEQRTWGNDNYRYMNYPLPELIVDLRSAIYPRLVPIANGWNERMEVAERFPINHQDYLEICRQAGQAVSTSMLVEHTVGQQALLHQDIYGEHVFPLQVAIALSKQDRDYVGGEFVITEQRPRMQTRPEVITLDRGDAVILAVSNRPVTGTRGTYRVNLRHGFSKVREGRQRALNITLHDAPSDRSRSLPN